MSEDTMDANTAKRKAALWVAVVFVLGVALGGVFGYYYAGRVAAASKPAVLSEPERRARRLDQLTHDLSLTEAQRQQMGSLLLQFHGEYQAIREKNAAQLETDMEAERQKSRDQIRAMLTQEQKPKFEEFLRKLDQDRKKNAAQQQPGQPQTPSSH